MLQIKNIAKLGAIVIIVDNYIGATHSIYNLKYSVHKDIPIVFHNGYNYDYHFEN